MDWKYDILIAPQIHHLKIEVNNLIKQKGRDKVKLIGGPNTDGNTWFQAVMIVESIDVK